MSNYILLKRSSTFNSTSVSSRRSSNENQKSALYKPKQQAQNYLPVAKSVTVVEWVDVTNRKMSSYIHYHNILIITYNTMCNWYRIAPDIQIHVWWIESRRSPIYLHEMSRCENTILVEEAILIPVFPQNGETIIRCNEMIKIGFTFSA